MLEFPNTHEQNYNVLIIIIELYEFSFASDAGSSCAERTALMSIM